MGPPPPKYLTNDPAAIKSFLSSYDTFLFDCDGVLYTGPTPIPHAARTIAYLLSLKKRIYFLTNNSTKSRPTHLSHLHSLHFPLTLTSSQIFTSASASATFIKTALLPDLPEGRRKVFLIGEKGVEDELKEVGVEVVVVKAEDGNGEVWNGLAGGKGLDDGVGVVLVGLDFHLTYLKLALAFAYIRVRGAVFLTTNPDTTLPASGGLQPGAGACAAPLIAMLGHGPRECLGKPGIGMLRAVEAAVEAGGEAEGGKLDRSRTVMVGDRLDTDIQFGVGGGLGTLCVLTGVTRGRGDWEGEGMEGVRPGFWCQGVGDLSEGWEGGEEG